jgi:tRNA(Leu) C34 or U34 (ribose-2'-O)-methylase TrmL
MIEKAFAELSAVQVLLFEPEETPNAGTISRQAAGGYTKERVN